MFKVIEAERALPGASCACNNNVIKSRLGAM